MRSIGFQLINRVIGGRGRTQVALVSVKTVGFHGGENLGRFGDLFGDVWRSRRLVRGKRAMFENNAGWIKIYA